jgi:prepilin-type N-terminal cleavage/methylation domain-containing protein
MAIIRPRHDHAQDGLTIIEVMVASALLLVVATAVFTAVYSGLRLQATARQRAAATAWADHLMELARNQNYDAIGLSSTGTAIDAAVAAIPAGDTDNPDLLLRRNGASNCLELNTGTAASPAWERLVVADWYTPPNAAATCATQTVNNDFHLVHAGGANDHVAPGTPAVTYSGWAFVTWAPVDGLSNVYYKRVTVMVRFPSPTGGISRLVRASSLFSLGYVPAPSSPGSSTSTSTSTSTTTTIAGPTTTTLPAGCVPQADDTQGPAGSITLAGGAGYTNQTGLAINNSVTDQPSASGASGMATMQYSNTGPSGPWQPSPAAAFGALYSGWPVPAGDGTKQVWARFTDCNGNTSPAVISDTIVLDQTRPPAPTLTGTPGHKRIDLSWGAVTDPGASASGIANYRVYRLDQGTTTPIAMPTGTSYRDNGLTNGQAYTYWVTAVDRAGNESSPESNHYTGTPG